VRSDNDHAATGGHGTAGVSLDVNLNILLLQPELVAATRPSSTASGNLTRNAASSSAGVAARGEPEPAGWSETCVPHDVDSQG
jgi:hypothetical protein